MKKLILLTVLLAVGFPIAGYAKPKMIVQLVAESIDSSALFQSIFVVLPDGSHAVAGCRTLEGSCGIDSFRPEKRIAKGCHSKEEPIATCYAGETYYATRKGNYITIYAANGARVYHITGSWDSFEDGYVRSAANSSSSAEKTTPALGFAALKNQALNGNPDAEFKEGYAYFSGQGVPQDYAQAAIWYRKAAEQGDPWAELNLGYLYANGQGVPQDNAEAYFWFDLAAAGKGAQPSRK